MINLSHSTFGKNLIDLTYEDIVTYFTEEHTESNNIEFKAFSTEHGNFNRDFKGVIRAICGLLNSDGGMVIWGAPLGVEDEATHEKKFQGNLAPVQEYKEKDVIINKVSDSISPLPVGINVQILRRADNENLYIFEVQPSPYKPHQFENIYLVRLDGQTKPAPHYFIEALYRRITYPNIEGYIKFNVADLHSPSALYYIDFTIFLFNFSRLQNEEDVMYRLTTTAGHFHSQANSQEPYNFIGQEPRLHFGSPMMNTQRIVITPQQIIQHNYTLHLTLSISGKRSPVKTSDYTLNLHNINLTNPNDTAQLVLAMAENELLSGKQDQLGTTRESTLFNILGRNP
jgi:hypothetical protein